MNELGKQYYELQKRGHTYTEIARLTGAKSRSAVAGRIRRYREAVNAPKIHSGKVSNQPIKPTKSAIRIAAEAVNPLGVSMLELKHGQCRYPYGTKPYNFCGHPVHEEKSYCKEHYELCRRVVSK